MAGEEFIILGLGVIASFGLTFFAVKKLKEEQKNLWSAIYSQCVPKVGAPIQPPVMTEEQEQQIMRDNAMERMKKIMDELQELKKIL